MSSEVPPLQHYGFPLPEVDISNLPGKLIVIEGPDSVGRSTQVRQLRFWLEQRGHAVVDTGMARSALTKTGIQEAKRGHTLGPMTMALFYMADFADRLENIIIPALRAGFVVLNDRYLFSVVARAAARGQDEEWLERVAGFALAPHITFYLRTKVVDLPARVICGQGGFDYWESGMDVPYGADRYASFVGYQARLVEVLDKMAEEHGFNVVDASQPPETIFQGLQQQIVRLLGD